MATANVYERDGSQAGTVDLPDNLFAADVSEVAVHQAVVTYLANQRQGTASTKERSDVRGGGAKPYRQKGTGRARAGTIRSPIWRGGGVVFGPHPRDYRMKLAKKVRRRALWSSLTSAAQDGGIVVVKDLDYTEPKTKQIVSLLGGMEASDKKILLVLDSANKATIKSTQNLRKVRVTLADMVTTYDVVWAERVVITSKALSRMEEVFSS